jgi:hypothetical protein
MSFPALCLIADGYRHGPERATPRIGIAESFTSLMAESAGFEPASACETRQLIRLRPYH